jgi:hypothetical protein
MMPIDYRARRTLWSFLLRFPLFSLSADGAMEHS